MSTSPESTPPSDLHKVLSTMSQAFEALGKEVPSAEIEEIGSLIHEVMTSKYRTYHTLEHIFSFGDDLTPIEVLAILAHDIVYWQIDRVEHPDLQKLISPHKLDQTGTIVIPALNQSHGPARTLSTTQQVFGFFAMDKIGPFSGANEYLSAYVAERLWGKILGKWEMIQVLACIEATIPFRKAGADGKTALMNLHERLSKLNAELQLKVTAEEIAAAVESATKVSNRDLGSFVYDDVAKFLRESWQIVLETNPVLEHANYRIREYRKALQKMEGFLSGLNAGEIFTPVNGLVNGKPCSEAMTIVARNLFLGVEYIRAKLLAIGIIEAVAAVTGGPAPLVLFTGAAHTDDGPRLIECRLSALSVHGRTGPNADVHRLLDRGRAGYSRFDRNRSPIAAFVYSELSESEFAAAVVTAKNFFVGKVSAEEFLCGSLKKQVLQLIPIFAELAWTRKFALDALARRLGALSSK